MARSSVKPRRRRRPGKPSPAAASPRRRTGGRSARVRVSVLEAAFARADRKGLSRLQASPRRPHAPASTRHRSIDRWKTKQALTLDAVLHFAEAAIPTPDTGIVEIRPDRSGCNAWSAIWPRPRVSRSCGRLWALPQQPQADAGRANLLEAALRLDSHRVRQGRGARRISRRRRPAGVLRDLDRAALFQALRQQRATRRMAIQESDRPEC